MARVLKLALTAFALQKACALDLAAETDLEEKDALGHRAYLDWPRPQGVLGRHRWGGQRRGPRSGGSGAEWPRPQGVLGRHRWGGQRWGSRSGGSGAEWPRPQGVLGRHRRGGQRRGSRSGSSGAEWPRPQGVLGRHRWGGQRRGPRSGGPGAEWPRPQGVLGRHRWGGQRGGLGLGHGGARCGRSPQGGPQACARAWFASGASRGCRQHGLRPARRQVVLGSSRQHVPGGAERLHD
ncbi:unnamed protein product [Prorocentrum cordatum]|uniref:Uncharacterized protein n=1 Tax=Prorocentrum cordatum TaxID=2364126 RepID=A0ABN9QTM0_9DINO|nr:unnamed protein product [Polarella glacialis]